MPRIRYLKPDFFTDEHISELPFEVRLVFQGLWCMADREGRLEDRPKHLKVVIMPYDSVDMENSLNILCSGPKPFISRYTVNDKQYIQILNFTKHQNPHHTEKESVIPAEDKEQEKEKIKISVKQASARLDNGEKTVKAPLNRFVKPTIEEIRAYCIERKNNIKPEAFFDSNEAKGWVVGKTRTPMKDWKSAIRTWEHNQFESAPVKAPAKVERKTPYGTGIIY